MSRFSIDCRHCNKVSQLELHHLNQENQCSHCGKGITDGCVIDLQPHNINAITKSKLPLMIYFWGANCSSCKMFMPIVEKIAKLSRGKYRFASVYVPKNQALAKRYRVRGIPSCVLLKNGKQQTFINGGLRQKELLQWLNSNS